MKRGRKKKLKTLEEVAPKATCVQADKNICNVSRQASRARATDGKKAKKK